MQEVANICFLVCQHHSKHPAQESRVPVSSKTFSPEHFTTRMRALRLYHKEETPRNKCQMLNLKWQKTRNSRKLTKLLMDVWSTGKVNLTDFKHKDYSQYRQIYLQFSAPWYCPGNPEDKSFFNVKIRGKVIELLFTNKTQSNWECFSHVH